MGFGYINHQKSKVNGQPKVNAEIDWAEPGSEKTEPGARTSKLPRKATPGSEKAEPGSGRRVISSFLEQRPNNHFFSHISTYYDPKRHIHHLPHLYMIKKTLKNNLLPSIITYFMIQDSFFTKTQNLLINLIFLVINLKWVWFHV